MVSSYHNGTVLCDCILSYLSVYFSMSGLPIKIKLPKGFLDEEVRDGYLVSSQIKKLWAVEIDILFQIKEICDRHNIKWVVDGGTLLGAARHGGFIPWDDDIDIGMLRADYDKFVFYAKRELKFPYFLQTTETDPHSMYGHAKIRNSLTTAMQKEERDNNYKYNLGVFVDIFPMDAAPDIKSKAEEVVTSAINYFAKARVLLYSTQYKWFLPLRKNIFKLIYDYLVLYTRKLQYILFGPSIYMKSYNKFEEIMKSYNNEQTNHVTVYAMGWKESTYWPLSFFEESQVMLPFEWFEVPAMKRYEEFMRLLYGEWRHYVKGTSIHGDLFVDPEKPYTYYVNRYGRR